MYRLIRPLLFLFPTEFIHKFAVSFIHTLFLISGVKKLANICLFVKNDKLNIEFAGLKFQSPVGLAAGFDKNAEFFDDFSNLGFSFIEIGTVTPQPQAGNPKPRSFRLVKDKALINRMGFNNKGIKEVVENLKKRKHGIIIGGNIGKNTDTPIEKAIDDYEACFKKLYNFIDYFAVNVSCPNIANLNVLQNPAELEKILSRLAGMRKSNDVYRPILLKISPDLNHKQIDDIIHIYKKTGIDGIIATNTTIQRDNLATSSKRLETIGSGGLSGKPLTHRSNEIIRYISEKSKNTIPVIGVGGIMSPEDVIDKLKAGAKLVQVYTGFIYEGPFFVKRINKAIAEYLVNS